jgi:hypothetical protein
MTIRHDTRMNVKCIRENLKHKVFNSLIFLPKSNFNCGLVLDHRADFFPNVHREYKQA